MGGALSINPYSALAVTSATGAGCIIVAKVVNYIFPWLKYDIEYIKAVANILWKISKYGKKKPIYTMVDRFSDLAKTQPTKTFAYFEDQIWTYEKMNNLTNKVARVFWDSGIRTNDTVAIIMNSIPEFVGVWFGIGKTGATSAFINYNIRGKSLMHCLNVSECKSIVIENDPELLKAINEIKDDIKEKGIKIYVLGESDKEPTVDFRYQSLDVLMARQSDSEVPREWRRDLTMGSHFCYVYTSGTTGLPKAALIRQDRAWLASQLIVTGGGKYDDVIYSPLPLYHAAAGMIGVLGATNLGCSVILKKKFSARGFWDDCRKYKATFVQYIGETMRYICDTPPHPEDKNHCVRAAIGNGLRPAVWKKFHDRFGEHILIREIYAATEGNVGFINLDNHVGSIGTFSPLMNALKICRFVKYDKEKEEAHRDENGRCVDVPDGTPGLLIVKITSRTAFHGYRGNKKQTESKILHGAFQDGDAYFNSGDLIRRDPDYHMYFVDRVGDTFRWKGENVSTNEVADVMSEAPSVREANVYGVEVPGTEGRAGMVVVLLEENKEFDGSAVYNHACTYLATYARPIFLRIKDELELTGTFKQKKVTLVNEGFNPTSMEGDPLFYLNHKSKTYSPLTQEVYDKIVGNEIRI